MKDIQNYEGLYAITETGKVWSHRKQRFIGSGLDKDGYEFVRLWKNNIIKAYKVHRLVAIHYIPNPNNYPQVNHKDEVKHNNNVSNLEWCTREYNQNYGTINERRSKTRKLRNQSKKL